MTLKGKIVCVLLATALLGSAPSHAQSGDGAAATTATGKAEPADRKLFALILRPGAAWRPGRPFAEQGLRPHFDYWKTLFGAGRIATAGPLGSDSGLVLLFAADREEAEAVMGADPAIQARIFTGDVRPYAPPMINTEALATSD